MRALRNLWLVVCLSQLILAGAVRGTSAPVPGLAPTSAESFCATWLKAFAGGGRTFVPFGKTLASLYGKPCPPGTLGSLQPGVYRRQTAGPGNTRYPETVTALFALSEHEDPEPGAAFFHLHIPGISDIVRFANVASTTSFHPMRDGRAPDLEQTIHFGQDGSIQIRPTSLDELPVVYVFDPVATAELSQNLNPQPEPVTAPVPVVASPPEAIPIAAFAPPEENAYPPHATAPEEVVALIPPVTLTLRPASPIPDFPADLHLVVRYPGGPPTLEWTLPPENQADGADPLMIEILSGNEVRLRPANLENGELVADPRYQGAVYHVENGLIPESLVPEPTHVTLAAGTARVRRPTTPINEVRYRQLMRNLSGNDKTAKVAALRELTGFPGTGKATLDARAVKPLSDALADTDSDVRIAAQILLNGRDDAFSLAAISRTLFAQRPVESFGEGVHAVFGLLDRPNVTLPFETNYAAASALIGRTDPAAIHVIDQALFRGPMWHDDRNPLIFRALMAALDYARANGSVEVRKEVSDLVRERVESTILINRVQRGLVPPPTRQPPRQWHSLVLEALLDPVGSVDSFQRPSGGWNAGGAFSGINANGDLTFPDHLELTAYYHELVDPPTAVHATAPPTGVEPARYRALLRDIYRVERDPDAAYNALVELARAPGGVVLDARAVGPLAWALGSCEKKVRDAASAFLRGRNDPYSLEAITRLLYFRRLRTIADIPGHVVLGTNWNSPRVLGGRESFEAAARALVGRTDAAAVSLMDQFMTPRTVFFPSLSQRRIWLPFEDFDTSILLDALKYAKANGSPEVKQQVSNIVRERVAATLLVNSVQRGLVPPPTRQPPRQWADRILSQLLQPVSQLGVGTGRRTDGRWFAVGEFNGTTNDGNLTFYNRLEPTPLYHDLVD